MPLSVKESGEIEESLTYASYERETETSFLLSGNKSKNGITKSTFLKDSADPEGDGHNDGKMLAPRSRGAIVMAACLFMTMSSFGMANGLGVVYVELISAFQCPRSQAALVQSLYVGLTLCGGLFFTKIITKYDTGACVMVAAVLACVTSACGSLGPDIGTVIALVGVVLGFFASVNIICAYAVVNWTFVNNRKVALGILTLGSTLGQTVLPYIANALIQSYSWRGCLLIIGAIAYLNCIPCGLVIHFSKKYFHTGENANDQNAGTSIVSFFMDSAFVVYIVASFLFVTFGPVELWFVVDLAVFKGFGVKAGTVLLSLNGIFGFAGRVLSTVVLKFFPNHRPELHMCNGFMLWALAHLGVIAANAYWVAFLSMAVRGLATSITIVYLPALQLELKGPENFPKTVAITNMMMGVGGILGGYFGGYSVDVTGSYNLIFYIATVGTVYCGLSMLFLYIIFKRRRRYSKVYQKLP